MPHNIVNVVEKEILLPYLVSYFTMNVLILELNKSCCVIATTYDINNNKLYEKQYIVEDIEYQNWGSNDDYLKQLIANKLNLVIQ